MNAVVDVSTGNGKVRGKVVELTNCPDGKPVSVFRNIPFAKPPVGSLRFMPPIPADPWRDVIDGTKLGPRPMQQYAGIELMDNAYPMPIPKGDIGMDEDCLHLTVYSTDPRKGKKLPVMVYLYGGGFQMGSEVDHDASVIAGLNDVVVIVPNYRVGIFGFLSLGKNSPCSGNAGILDQHLALKWVQQNIEVFGGDRNNVTIYGESAGGVSVHLNVVSPLSKGLFHKAISCSGQISNPLMFNNKEKSKAALDYTLKALNIKTEDPLKILEELQAMPVKKLLPISDELEQNMIPFLPTVDGNVFEKPPRDNLIRKEFPKIPYIIGCNSTEGAGLLTMFFQNPNQEEGTTERFAKSVCPLPVTDEEWEDLKEYYVPNEKEDKRFEKLLSEIGHDVFAAVPVMHDAKFHVESGAPVYVYLGDFRLNLHHDEDYGKVTKKSDSCVCDHGDDVFMTFGCPFTNHEQPHGAKYSKEEKALSRKWMSYLTNFAKTGDPNRGSKLADHWPEFKTGNILVLNHKITTMKNYKLEAVKFWMGRMKRVMLSAQT